MWLWTLWFPVSLNLRRLPKKTVLALLLMLKKQTVLICHLIFLKCWQLINRFKIWDGLGLVVQAYQKRAPYVIDWLTTLGRYLGRKIMVRLVKGAYWDSEIKHAPRSRSIGLSGLYKKTFN